MRAVTAEDCERELKSLKIPLKVSTPCFSNQLPHKQLGLEARVGIEPTNAAFAEPCLTTWLPRPNQGGGKDKGRAPRRKCLFLGPG
jgi:hypothetical protein